MKTALILSLLFTFSAAQLNLDDEKDNQRLKYGMSQAEWEMFQQSGLSIKELEELISCGIAFNEYGSRPWLSLGVNKKQWLDDRCKGMGDEDIQAFHETKSKNDFAIILAFLAPGSYHWPRKSYGTASLLSGVFIGSVAAYFLFPAKEIGTRVELEGGGYETPVTETGRPMFLVVALADMVISGVLAYRDFNKPPVSETTDETEAIQGSFHPDFKSGRPGLQYVLKF